jgi:hypothetical protein
MVGRGGCRGEEVAGFNARRRIASNGGKIDRVPVRSLERRRSRPCASRPRTPCALAGAFQQSLLYHNDAGLRIRHLCPNGRGTNRARIGVGARIRLCSPQDFGVKSRIALALVKKANLTSVDRVIADGPARTRSPASVKGRQKLKSRQETRRATASEAAPGRCRARNVV